MSEGGYPPGASAMRRLIATSLVAMVLAGAVALPRAEADDRSGSVHGHFVRRLEREHGDIAYLAIEVKTEDGKVTLLVPRRNEDITHMARRLTEGQEVRVRYIVDSGDKFVRGIEVGDKPKAADGDIRALRREVRELAEAVRRLRNEVAELREENRRLRREGEGRERKEKAEGRDSEESRQRKDKAERRDREESRDRKEKAEGREREGKAEPRKGKLRGKFVRLGERTHKEKRYRVIEVSHPESDAPQVFYVWPPRDQKAEGRHRELHQMAERLKRGQTVEISYGTEAGVRWASGIKAVGDRDREEKKEKDKDRRKED